MHAHTLCILYKIIVMVVRAMGNLLSCLLQIKQFGLFVKIIYSYYELKFKSYQAFVLRKKENV